MTTTYQSQTNVTNLYQQAEASLAQKQFQDTISLCRQILKAEPNFSSAYQTLGKALIAVGELDAAINTYRQLIQLEPNNAQAYTNLGSIYAQQKNWQAALKYYQRASQLNPNLATVYRNMARIWERLNQPEQAVKAWERAYSIEPDQVTSQDRLKLGDEFSKLGYIEKAIASYQRAVESAPNWGEAYQRLGDALAQAGRQEEAREAFNKAQEYGAQIATEPSKQQGPNHGPSNASIQKPERTNSYKSLAESYAENQQWQQVITNAKQALSIKEDAETWHLLGKALQATKQIQQAGHCYRKAIKLQPQPESYANLGSLYASQKQWQQAIASYQQALKLDSQQSAIWRNLARTFSRAGDPSRAALAWYRAYTLEPTQQSAQEHLQLGDTLVQHEKLTEAIACYQQAVEQQPNWALAHYRLGETLKQAGRQDEATASLRRAIECHGDEASQPTQANQERISDEKSTPSQETRSPVEQGEDRSKSLLKKALETDDPETYLELAQVYLDNQQCRRAIAAARQAVAIQPDANAYRWLGKALQQDNQIREAQSCYQTAISLEPNWAEPKIDLGDWHMAQKQWRQAITCYRDALKLDRNNGRAYRRLAQAFEGLGKYSKAVECRYRALSQAEDETTVEECIELARGLAKQNKWEEAINCYRKALELDPQATEAQRELGDLLVHQGQAREAIHCYRQVLQDNPDSIQTWQALGITLTDLGEHEEAEACYRQAQWLLTTAKETESPAALASSSSNHQSIESALRFQQQAEAALQRGESEVALKQYQEAFARLTGQSTATGQVDIFLFSEANIERLSLENSGNQSLESLTRLTFFTTTFPTFTKGLSWLLEQVAKLKWLILGKSPQNISWEQGKPSMKQVVEVAEEHATDENTESSPESFQELERRAKACLEADDLDRCLVTCEELVKHYPQHSEGYQLLGRGRYRKGELSLALEAYQKAIALNSQEVEARFWCGQILASQEQWQDAIAYYQKALEQDPQRWEIYHYLGEALEASGDLDGAIAAYEKATALAG